MANNNRGQARQGAAAADPIGRLAEILEGAIQMQAPRDRFKAPRYDGKGDVELFLTQFHDVANANQWNAETAVLNLRLSLEKEATECGRGPDIASVTANLRARFGLTIRQARDRLATLRKEPSQSFHTLGVEVQRLVRLAYPTMAANDQMVIAIESLKRCVENKSLSRHLLAVPADTVEAITTAADEFIQAGTPTTLSRSSRATVNHIEVQSDENK